MNEDEYKSAYQAINERSCPFEKSILSRQCGCQYAYRFHIADREGTACRCDAAQRACISLLRLLRRNAQVALGLSAPPGNLPHGKEMKVQMGGLLGLQCLVAPSADTTKVDNVHGLVQAAERAYGNLQTLPFSEIIRSIASYRGRRRRRTRRT